MNSAIARLQAFFGAPFRRRLFYIAVLFLFAAVDIALAARSTRVFEFVSILDGRTELERRFLPRTFSREESVRRYVAEYLLGPTDIEFAMPFYRGTSLRSVMVRGGVAYVDLSASAALPADEGLDVRRSLDILIMGIKLNFPSLKDAKVYIEGHEPYADSVSETPQNGSVPKKGKSVDK